jgi:hypothetical protein
MKIISSGDVDITATLVDVTGALTTSGRVQVDDTTDATSKTDGSLQTDGGLSVAKAIYNGTAATLAADSGVVTMGSATAATVSAAGIINVNNTTDATSKTDGSLQTDGGLSVAKAIYNGTAATLAADSGVVTMGSATAATVSAAGIINVNNTTDATSKTDGSLQTDGGLSVAKAIYNGTAATLAADSGVVTMGSATAATVSAAGIINVNNTTEATSTTDGSLQTDGGLSVAKDCVFGNDVKLLSDSAVLNFGASSEINLTHVADTGLILAENTNNATGPTLRLSNVRGANAGVDNDVAGNIEFFNNDNGNNSQSFGHIKMIASAVAAGSEVGKLDFGVACSDDGGVDTCMTLEGGTAASSSVLTVLGEIVCSSDENLKTNIQPIESATEKLNELNGVSFNWKSSNAPSFGVIAQQVESVMPNAVRRHNGTKTVNYNAVVGLLVQALKEQNGRYESLEKQFQEFQNKE